MWFNRGMSLDERAFFTDRDPPGEVHLPEVPAHERLSDPLGTPP